MAKQMNPYADGAIVVSVVSGVIQDIEQIPAGVTVRIVDFDIDGTDADEVRRVKVKGITKRLATVVDWESRIALKLPGGKLQFGSK